jgi:hypothetical protein
VSRILARATGAWAGQPTLRPRLPLLFEPGLDVRVPGGDGEPAAEWAATSAWAGPPGTAGAEPDSEEAASGMPADQGAAAPGALGPGWPDGDGPGQERQTAAGRAARPAIAPRDQDRPAGSLRLADMAAIGAATGAGAGVPATWPARAAVTGPGAARPASAARFQPAGRRPAGLGLRPGDDQATAGQGGRRRSYPVRPVPHEDGPGPGPVPAALDLPHVPASADMPAASAWAAVPAVAAISAAVPGPSAAPVVRIEIGRVEIRAEPAPARPAASQPGRPAGCRRPAPDLAEYLKRRDGRP